MGIGVGRGKGRGRVIGVIGIIRTGISISISFGMCIGTGISLSVDKYWCG